MTKFELCGRHAIYMMILSRMPETFFGTTLNLPDILEALSHIWKLILFKSTLHFLIVLVSRWAKPIPAFSSPPTGTVYISLSDRTPSFVTYRMDGNHELISIGNIWCCISRHTRYFSVIYFLNDHWVAFLGQELDEIILASCTRVCCFILPFWFWIRPCL